MTADADPVKAAVEAALREQITAWWQTPPRLDWAAGYAVEAHRRAVLDQRDDGEKWAEIRVWADAFRGTPAEESWTFIFAALADTEIARRQAEAEAWAQIEAAGRIEQERDRLAERAGLPEWRCPGCGAVTRARMADHGEDG